jgi:hypothetical protein
MNLIREFVTDFGWAEFGITVIIVATIVLIREKHLIFKKNKPPLHPPSQE